MPPRAADWSFIMKKIRFIGICLAIAMLFCALTACAEKKNTSNIIMSISDGEISCEMDVGVYTFLLSRMRGTLSYYDYDVSSDKFWRTVISSDNRTWDDHFSNTIFDQAKLYLTIEYLFEKEGLTLEESREKKIDATMEGLVSKAGSKVALNTTLKNYGVNYEMLREIYVIEQKYSQLMSYLYGENGEKIIEFEKNKYYSENYVAFGQIFLPIYDVVTDENGQEGMAFYSEEKKAEILERAKQYSEDCNGRLEKFKEYCALYSGVEDSVEPTYLFVQSEYYGLQSQSSAYLDTMASELAKMAVGECRVVVSPYGYHVICRYAREDKAYDNEDYKESFSDFYAMLSDKLFNEKCDGYADIITVYNDVDRPKISEVATNKLY